MSNQRIVTFKTSVNAKGKTNYSRIYPNQSTKTVRSCVADFEMIKKKANRVETKEDGRFTVYDFYM